LTPDNAVIIDELGYLPFPQSGGALLFHLVSQLSATAPTSCIHAVVRENVVDYNHQSGFR